jgi:hypothetical protein
MGLRCGASGVGAPPTESARPPVVVASTLPATLTVGGGVRPQSFAVGRKPRCLQVAVPSGRAPLVLSLRLVAFGKTSSSTLTLPRG